MSNDPVNLYDYEERAKLTLPHNDWDTIDAGAMDMFTTRRNRTAFESLTLRPRFLRTVEERDLSTTVLGEKISMPVVLAPAGSHMRAHPEGEVATARGAGMSDTLMMLSTSSNCSMEEVSQAASGPLWFQLYHRGYELTEMLVHRAEEAGFKAIVLTVDTPVPSPKERDLRNNTIRTNELGNFQGTDRPRSEISGTDETPGWDVSRTEPLTWSELDWLRGLTRLPLVLKGIRTAEDAHVAVESGVNGIQVSTHGGRQLDMTMGAIEMLPEIADAVKGQAEIYLDSGVRRGSDVIKALALGARAVAIGRPLFWGLAVDGANGVHGVLELMREEVDRAMAYCGQTSVEDLEPNLIGIPDGWGSGSRMAP
jgi:isopentenyl diphosphate isomerase/L-lactate dehydrogenase-like FMN-dependent dehydrogenase